LGSMERSPLVKGHAHATKSQLVTSQDCRERTPYVWQKKEGRFVKSRRNRKRCVEKQTQGPVRSPKSKIKKGQSTATPIGKKDIIFKKRD